MLVWEYMSAVRIGNLPFIDGIMDHKMYIEILKKNLYVSTQNIRNCDNYISNMTTIILSIQLTIRNNGFGVHYTKELHTSPQSPDFNPIEHLWSILRDAVRKRQIFYREDLKITLREEWESISPSREI